MVALMLSAAIFLLGATSVSATSASVSSPNGTGSYGSYDCCPACGSSDLTLSTRLISTEIYPTICTHYEKGSDYVYVYTVEETEACNRCSYVGTSCRTSTVVECHGSDE